MIYWILLIQKHAIRLLLTIYDGRKDAIITKLFTKKSNHGNLSVIYIEQNLFYHSKEHRTISLNASYLCLTKNVRDASQIIHLAKQLYPNHTKFFSELINWPPKNPIRTYSLTLPPHVLMKYGFDPGSFRQTHIMSINPEYK